MSRTNKKISTLPAILAIAIPAIFASCKKFIAIDPPKTEIVSAAVFENDLSAKSAIQGIYSMMMTSSNFAKAGLEEYTGILSDEFINYSTRIDQVQFYQNSLVEKNADVLGIFWGPAYKYILNANAILEGIEQSSGLSIDVKKQLEGEAKFVRAYCYFYLVNLFGEIPYLTTADYRINAKMARSSVGHVYNNIERDLTDAHTLLKYDYSFSNGERIQPNKGAVEALLSRVYLYTGQWAKAVQFATLLINNTPLYSLHPDLNKVFLANSTETIWQLRPVVPGVNTPQGQLFILFNPPNSASARVSLTPHFMNSFEPNDQRKLKWTKDFSNASGTWHYCYKYKVSSGSTVTEYSMIFRLAEQYLIRAEARAQSGDIANSVADLNVLRVRAGLNALSSSISKDDCLKAIEQERKIELFAEAGHRWLDLKRTGRATSVLSPLKSNWQPTDVLLPIPEAERLLNPQLTQNDGY